MIRPDFLEIVTLNQDKSIKVTLRCHVSFDLNLQVQVVDWMKGQTCGLCGKADGEMRQEYHMPSGHMAKNAVTYAHSWILGAKSCRDNSGETQEGSKEH